MIQPESNSVMQDSDSIEAKLETTRLVTKRPIDELQSNRDRQSGLRTSLDPAISLQGLLTACD